MKRGDTMKKILALTLALVLALSLCACGGGNADTTTTDNGDAADTATVEIPPVEDLTGTDTSAIPGVKLGVANVITLFALWTLGWREAGAILVVRIFLGNLIVGNMMGMLYSMAGGVLCWVVMCLVKPLIDRRHIWVMSMLGAVGHNVGQLAVAVWVSGTAAIALYAPVLLLAGLVTGFFTGQCAQAVLNHMDKIQKGS